MDSAAYYGYGQPISVKLWPPKENTRKTLLERMTNNLATQTIFTQKFGLLDKEEAETHARRIEDLAFTIASEHFEKAPDGDGGSAIQLYAKESSRLILEVLKQGQIGKMEVQPSNSSTATVGSVFDISKGQRAFITAKEALELLSPLKKSTSSPSKICFSNKSFGLDAAGVAEPILVSLKDQLREVDLSDFIAGRPEEEALKVVNIFSTALEGSVLKSLNLSNNALGEKGIRAFGSLLKSQTCLEELYLMNDGISEEAARALCELIPSTDKLRVLHFHNNMTGDEGALAISDVVKRSPLLEDFRCSSTRIASEGGVALADSLKNCIHMEKLDLRDNMFGVEGGIALSEALTKQPKLKEVYFSYLNLEDGGVVAIANVLKESAPHLEVLEMSGNDITSEAAPSVASCIATKQKLANLNLSENELRDEGTIHISKALEGLNQLKKVDFSSNSVRRDGARVLAQVLVHKDGFELLNLNGNYISDEGIQEVKAIFKKSPELLGALDENDPEGGDDDEYEDSSEGETNNNELGSELGSELMNLEVTPSQ